MRRFAVLALAILISPAARAGSWDVRLAVRSFALVRDSAESSTLWTCSDQLYRSRDGGLSWKAVGDSPLDYVDGIAVVSDMVFVLGFDGGSRIFATRDEGATWSDVALPAGSADGGVIGLVGQDGKLFVLTATDLLRSEDFGETWTSIGQVISGFVQFASFAVDPASSSHLVVADLYRGIYVTDDKGNTWRESNDGITIGPDTLLAVLAIAGDRLYARAIPVEGCPSAYSRTRFDVPSTGDAFYRSDDDGRTWTAGATIPNDGGGVSAAVDTSDPRHIVVGSLGACGLVAGNAFESGDAGDSWIRIDRGFGPTHFYGISLAPDASVLVTATTEGVAVYSTERAQKRVRTVPSASASVVRPDRP
jgi:photosystem II stability/assembly factor-like uncharacterized protein